MYVCRCAHNVWEHVWVCVCACQCMRTYVCMYVGECMCVCLCAWFGLYASTIFESNPLLTPVDRWQPVEKSESESEFACCYCCCGIHRKRDPTKKNYRHSIMKHDNKANFMLYIHTHTHTRDLFSCSSSSSSCYCVGCQANFWILLADNLARDTCAPISSTIRNL